MKVCFLKGRIGMKKQTRSAPEIDARAVANLARLSLTEVEADAMAAQMRAIVEFAGKLSELDCGDAAVTAHVVPLSNIMREDTVEEPFERDALLANAPTKADGFFTVPRVVDG